MKIILIIGVFCTYLFAEVYFSKVEPYKYKYIASDTSGIVEMVAEDMLGKKLTKAPYIRIESKIDRAELKYTKQKIVYLKETIEYSEEMLKNLKESLKRKKRNYKKVEALTIKSRVEKDREFYDLVATQNSFIATQKEIDSLRIQIADLQLRKLTLEKILRDKNLRAKGWVLYALDVKEGQVVTKGTPLAKLADISKGLLTLYVTKEDLQNISKKVIYIDGKKTHYHISRYETIADSIHISKYKAQIIIEAPTVFSQLCKIELKEDKE